MKTFKLIISVFILSVVIFACGKENTNVSNNEQTSLQKQKLATIIKISPEQLLKMLKYDTTAFVIDVRKPNPNIRSCKMIKGYRHLQDSLIYQDIDLLPKNKSIILISKSGKRSTKLAEFLVNKNISVYVLEGGMDAYWAWREQIIRDKLHIYDKEIEVIELFADDFGC